MMSNVWLDANMVAKRYGAGAKWVWYKMRTDPNFPKGIRFSAGMTRWNLEQLNQYDELMLSIQTDQ